MVILNFDFVICNITLASFGHLLLVISCVLTQQA